MRHVYIHVPFCARRCVYCDFAIAVRPETPSQRFSDAVLSELDVRRNSATWDDDPIETLYLGGGTPSRLEPQSLERLLIHVRERAGPRVERSAEVTLEANPEDVTENAATAWSAMGINRVSLGVQSFQPNVLNWMHRLHSAEQSAHAVHLLRDAGITNVSVDLMFGLAPDLEHDFESDLETTIGLEPDHVSVYGLTVEPQTALSHRVARGEAVASPDPRYEREFLMAHRLLTEVGLEHYEISNYARPRHRAVHNSAYWSGRPYAGLGPSAHSLRGNRRRWNEREWTRYASVVEGGGDPEAGSELLTPNQLALERLMLGIRTSEGFALPDLGGRGKLAELVDKGWLQVDGNQARLTPEGWLRTEAILTRLTTSGNGG